MRGPVFFPCEVRIIMVPAWRPVMWDEQGDSRAQSLLAADIMITGKVVLAGRRAQPAPVGESRALLKMANPHKR